MPSVDLIIKFFIAFFMTLILGLLLGIWIIKKINLAHDKFLERKLDEPYIKPSKAATVIAKENYSILAWYSLYFVIVILVLVHFFGRIEYGANVPYITLLISVGIPFLIAFAHVPRLIIRANGIR